MRKKEKLLLKYSVDEKRASEVFSYLEIAFIFGVFVVVLYLLYPKGMLKRQVLQEQSNYELTAIYLKNMLRIEPNNINLILATARVLVKEKKIDLAEELIEVLKNSKNSSLKRDIIALEFELLKLKREKVNKKERDKVKKIEQKMVEVLRDLAKVGIDSQTEGKKWSVEAINLKDKVDALEFLRPLNRAGDIASLEECVYISADLKNRKRGIECLEKLVELDKKSIKKWSLALYSLYLEEKSYQKAYNEAKKLAEIDPTFKSEPARVKILEHKYKEASKEYLKLYNKEKSPKKRVDYLFKAIYTLSNGGDIDEAVKLAKSYQNSYLKSSEFADRFIKFYLSVSRLKEARDLAKKILDLELSR